jgi:hypothetical protein
VSPVHYDGADANFRQGLGDERAADTGADDRRSLAPYTLGVP